MGLLWGSKSIFAPVGTKAGGVPYRTLCGKSTY